MNVVNILRKSGRMELADLASLLLPVSVVRKEKDGPTDDESGKDCEECEEDDEEECVACRLRGIIHKADQNGKQAMKTCILRGAKLGADGKSFPSIFGRSSQRARGTVKQ
jgi:hypothetical protein